MASSPAEPAIAVPKTPVEPGSASLLDAEVARVLTQLEGARKQLTLDVEGHQLRVANLDKVLFPVSGITFTLLVIGTVLLVGALTYLPALALRQGGAVVSEPVNHRPRVRGASNYGTLDRLLVGIFDLIGMAWLQRRGRRPVIETDPGA